MSFVMSTCMSACPSVWDNTAHTGRVFLKLDDFSKKCAENLSVIKFLTRITITLYEYLCTCVTIYRSVLYTCRWEIFPAKFVEETKPHILSSKTFFRETYLMWGNVNKYCRAREAPDDNIIMRVRITSYTTNVTDTHSQYIVPTASRIEVQEKLFCFCEILQRTFLKQT
jgi:hypothetical protein